MAGLVSAGRPLNRDELAELAKIDMNQIDPIILKLEKILTQIGLRIVESNGVYELGILPVAVKSVAHYFARHAQPLSSAALEVLTIVAYQQPVDKKAIDAQRGIASDASLKTLLSRGLIMVQKGSDVSQPAYATTTQFLLTLDIKQLEDLPKIKGMKHAT